MLAMLAAMKSEVAGLKSRMTVEETISAEGYRAFRGKYRGRPLLLVQTGVGPERASKAAQFVLQNYPVKTLVSFGVAGALTEHSYVGDIIVCSALACGDRAGASLCKCDADLVSLAMQVLIGGVTRVRPGKSVTVARPVCQAAAKQALGETLQAEAVDMESYWIARLAEEKHVPYLAVRAISDTMLEPMPPFDRMVDDNGRRSRRKRFVYFLTHPFQLADYWRMKRNVRRASAILTTYLDRLIERLPQVR